MTACPSGLAIDDAELHGGDVALKEHLRGCAGCQVRHRERAVAVALFEETMARPMWSRLAAASVARRGRRRWPLVPGWRALLAGAGVCGVVVALVATLAPPGGGPPGGVGGRYVGPKGRVATDVICRRGDRVFVLGSDDDVAPGDELRFRPRALGAEARFIQIGSVDGTGRYTPFYPGQTGRSSVALPASGEALPGSIRLDDAPGPERVLVVVSATPLAVSAVGRAAVAMSSDTKPINAIDGVPVHSTWVVFAKKGEGPSAAPGAP